ncbi:MAG: FecR domain-containing protein [Bacteroidales bacterium]|jgi:ferric-dicitrate binding protein FerR (iron transport regulator)
MFVNTPNHFLQNPDFIAWRLFRTTRQDKYWEAFRKENPHLEEAMDQAIEQFQLVSLQTGLLSDEKKKSIYEHIRKKIRNRQRRRRLIIYTSAAAVLLMGLFIGRFIFQEKAGKSESIFDNYPIVGQELPAEDIYIISGEQKTTIADKSDIQLTGKAKAVVIDKHEDKTENRQEVVLEPVEMHTLLVPYGRRTSIVLSDGTKVWLNSGTRVDFPSEFRGKTREIRVEGEVYMDVAEDAKKPFIVYAKDIHVQVYGTSFNVSAYKEEEAVTVVLVEGKVAVKTQDERVELSPNQKMIVTENDCILEDVDVNNYISWVKGVIVLDETPMLDILKKVGKYYNMHFEESADNTLNEHTCSGKLYLSTSVDSVMVSLSSISATKFERNENNIYISKKDDAYEQMPMKE